MLILDFRKYPFLKPLEDELNKYAGGVSLNDLLVSGSYYLDQAKERIDKILKDKELESYDKIKDSVLVFYTTLYLVAALDNDILKKKFLDKESQMIEKNLLNESEETVVEIAKYLGLNINYDNIEIKYKKNKKILSLSLKYSLNFIDFLKYTRELRKIDNKFSLASHILKDGKVYMTKEEIVKILVFQIRDKLMKMVNVSDVVIPEQIRKLADELKGRKTPPCILELKRKKELNNTELEVLITYYIDIGDEKSAIDLTKDENVIKKFKGDKKTKYIIYSCKKMKELGLCVASCNTLNPLQFYYGKLE
ncbi:DNA primase regulatory subunit PriL [Sulfolobus sp. S-194]|uniref:DNA primase regulatory subunit PriL n=1 Tax=Sulfolobus sp. S-194 TaxID=2512240 RepID=UPI0014399348|nr:DNA primase regulatory subunit PriL [Sulfolobus sp. S-194]